MPRTYPKTDLPSPVDLPLLPGDVVTYGLRRQGADRRSSIHSGAVVQERARVYIAPAALKEPPRYLHEVFLRTVRRDDVLVARAPYVLGDR